MGSEGFSKYEDSNKVMFVISEFRRIFHICHTGVASNFQNTSYSNALPLQRGGGGGCYLPQCHEFPWILVCFHLVLCSPSPVISDPVTPTCPAISSSLSPGFLRPSLHLQLISSLVALYLYLSTLTCSLPDCLVCFCQAIPRLFCYFYYPVFWLTDLLVLTLPACPSDSEYSACSLSDCLYTWRISWFWPCFGIQSKMTSATHCVCCRAFGFQLVCT